MPRSAFTIVLVLPSQEVVGAERIIRLMTVLRAHGRLDRLT